VILDIMPHVIAVLAHFGQVETLRVTQVRAGKYAGVDGDPNKPSEIAQETYAEVRFRFISINKDDVEGQAYVGKAIKGVRGLKSDYDGDGNTKLLEIEGEDGRVVKFDFRDRRAGIPDTRSKARLLDRAGNCHFEFDLNSDPYYAFLENVTSGGKIDQRLGLSIEAGKKILEVIQDMRHGILKRDDELPTYPCGIQNVRESLYVEDLNLPLIYGVEDSSAQAAQVRGPVDARRIQHV
jgi:predicted dehydrogenase